MNFFFCRVGLVFALYYPRALTSPFGPYPSHRPHSRQRALSWQEKQSVKLCLFFFFKSSSTNSSSTESFWEKKTALQPTCLQLSPLQPILSQQTSLEQIPSFSLTNSRLPQRILLKFPPQLFIKHTSLLLVFSFSNLETNLYQTLPLFL